MDESCNGNDPEVTPTVTLVTNIMMVLISDLENASRLYDKIFESIIRIHYSSTVYKQLDRLVCRQNARIQFPRIHAHHEIAINSNKLFQVLERLHPMVSEICQNETLNSSLLNQFSQSVPLQTFELCYCFRRFYNFGKLLNHSERKCLQLYK